MSDSELTTTSVSHLIMTYTFFIGFIVAVPILFNTFLVSTQ